MSTKKSTYDRDDGCRPNRRDFNATLFALLVCAFAPLRLGSGSSSDHGRWVLNERDR